MTMRHSRRGMTVIELLIVIAVISLLAALTAGAVYKIKEGQEKSFTETTLRKLASRLDLHWKAVIETAKEDYAGLPNNVKQELLTLADNDGSVAGLPKPHPRRDDRARLLYVKLRLKQEFPTSFSEAIDPCPVVKTTPPPSGRRNLLPGRDYPTGSITGYHAGKPAYVKFISDYMTASAASGVPITMNDFDSWSAQPSKPSKSYQSAILLALALEQPRKGLSLESMEQVVGASFMRDGVKDTENPTLTLPRYLVDSWGVPLRFSIFPTNDPIALTDLSIQSTQDRDPQDPEGLLTVPAESKWANAGFNADLLHPQIKAKLVPTIISAGRDGKFGYFEANETAKALDRTAGKNGWLLQPIIITDPLAAGRLPDDRFDNIYSHRLRQTGARGD